MNDAETEHVSRPRPGRARRRKRGRGFTLGCLGFLFVVFLVLVIAAKVLRPPAVEFAPGDPKTLEELNASYAAVPDAENAALRFSALVESGALKAYSRRNRNRPQAEPAAPGSEADSAMIALREKTADELHALLQLPGSRFPIDLSKGFRSRPGGHVFDVRSAAAFEYLLVKPAVEKGDSAECLARLEDLWRIGNLLKGEPMFASQLVRFAIDGTAAAATAYVFSNVTFDDGQLAKLAGIVAATRDEQALYRALAGERCNGMGRAERSMFTAASVQYIEPQLTASMAALRHSGPERVKKMNALKEETGSIHWQSFFGSRMYEQGFVLYPAIIRGNEEHMRTLITSDLVLTSIAIERFKIAHGTMPETLERLVPTLLPQVPVDPYCGSIVRYTIEADGYAVYSVGPDGIDHGGESGSQSKDIVFGVSKQRSSAGRAPAAIDRPGLFPFMYQ
jgi:hypothetical protein